MIELRNLRVMYGELCAVDDLSLRLEAGVFFGLLGPNGAGKSSALSCLAGLQTPSEGAVLVGGFDPRQRPREVQKLLGYAPQSLALYPSLTVLNNLKIFGGLVGLSKKNLSRRIDWALEAASLESHRRVRVGHLSGGMQRRLNLVAALLHDPQVLLCDEPTAGVDPQSRAHLFELLRRLHKEGRTILYTTHYMEEVEALCEEVAIMDRGRLLVCDRLSALLDAREEVHRFTLTTREGHQAEALRATLQKCGVDVYDIRSAHRSLEDVFLELTGRTLRDPA